MTTALSPIDVSDLKKGAASDADHALSLYWGSRTDHRTL
jgi:hypothetical protein